MKEQANHYIIEKSAVPKILKDTVEVNRLLKKGEVKTVQMALDKVGISRSAYYKYKNLVSPFNEINDGKIITFYAELNDEPGVLSSFLNLFAKADMNILTINQNIPINSLASITISARIGKISMDMETFLKKAKKLLGVVKIEVIASE